MKISQRWLSDMIDISDQPSETIAERLTHAGLEVEQISTYNEVKGNLDGVVIGQVLECQAHPNAQKLKKVSVDIGQASPLSVVCGADNVAPGQKVVVALPGTKLYPMQGEPIVIQPTTIRGELSQAMLCAEDEVGLGTDHSQIMVLDTNLPNGTPAAAYFQPYTDVIFEIGLTPNRADAASHWGVARDLRAIMRRPLQLPAIYEPLPDQTAGWQVVLENPEACLRYAALLLEGVQVMPSPRWLQQRLKAIGLRPINNVVDITNYVMHELGQPMHAFDADSIEGKTIFVKHLPENTPFLTLDGLERRLSASDLMICDAHKPLAMAGVMGGLHSGVSAGTRRVLLESACFHPSYVRRTANRHGLKTDASFRFERGTDPNMVLTALQRAAWLLQKLAAAKLHTAAVDAYPNPVEPRRVRLAYKKLYSLMGIEIPKKEVKQILQDLDINIIHEDEQHISLLVPTYRVDVSRGADIAEELLRIYGFDKVPLHTHLHTSFVSPFQPIEKDKAYLQDAITDYMVGQGFQEVITNSLTSPVFDQQIDQEEWGRSVTILNYSSEELSLLRRTLLFSGLQVILHNLNRQQKNHRIFEFGKIYAQKPDGSYAESMRLGIWMSGQHAGEHWSVQQRQFTFHDLAAIVERLLGQMRQQVVKRHAFSNKQWAYGLQYVVNDHVVARAGLVEPGILRQLDIKQDVWFADINWDWLTTHYCAELTVKELPKYPYVRRDLSLVLEKDTPWTAIEALAWRTIPTLLKHMQVFSVYEGKNIGEGKKSYAIMFILQDEQQTLTEDQIDYAMQSLMKAYRNELNALIRE